MNDAIYNSFGAKNGLPMQGNPGQSWILDRIPRCAGTAFLDLSVKLGFWIPIVIGIPDSLTCVPDCKSQDSGFPNMGEKLNCVIRK